MKNFLNKILYDISYSADIYVDELLPDSISKTVVLIDTPNSFLNTFIQPIMEFLMYLVGSLAFLSLIIAGFMYITAGYNEGNKKKAISIIKYVIIAIIFIILSYTIIEIIVKFF